YRRYLSHLRCCMNRHTQPGNRVYATLTGLPLSFDLRWPFHKSTSGADFWVLHADIRLENSVGLHAPVAVNLSATVREVMPTLEGEWVSANAALMAQAERFEADMRAALAELESKHAFERKTSTVDL